MALSNREEKVAAVDELIETELTLLGSTAIEDRLQDEVADTIQFCKDAGIKVWVLTGDKIETAIMIGLSAGLLDNEQKMDQYKTEETDPATLLKELVSILNEIKKRKNATVPKK